METRVESVGLSSIHELNALPAEMREALYARLVPDELFGRFRINRTTLRGPTGERLVSITAPEESPWARVEVRADASDRDPALLVDVEMSRFSVPELAFVQISDPSSPRYNIDRDDDGQDTLFGTASRNLAEESRALADGLAPGQGRRGLRFLGKMLSTMEAFCRLLGREFYLIEPLFYHSAILYERHGCGYFTGRERMEEIHQGFQPGGPYFSSLDGSTPFRRPGFDKTARGRSWAIHDGVLGEQWGGIKMYKAAGRHASLSTFPGGTY
jgi:hypothetical protein